MTTQRRAPEVWREMGLTDAEYERIVSLMGREPTDVELGMFAVMWSEHCGYKYSRPVLRLFRKYRESLEGAGFENAGVVPLDERLGIAFKVESHNHPSAVEPHQGAATGVGASLRGRGQYGWCTRWWSRTSRPRRLSRCSTSRRTPPRRTFGTCRASG